MDFEIAQADAAVVVALFKEFAKGRLGISKLIKRTGCPLSPSAVEALLSNVFYTGRVAYAGTVRWNKHERIVSDRLFNRVQRVRAERAKGGSVRFFKVIEGKEETAPLCTQR
jgi:hypothetical protein